MLTWLMKKTIYSFLYCLADTKGSLKLAVGRRNVEQCGGQQCGGLKCKIKSRSDCLIRPWIECLNVI